MTHDNTDRVRGNSLGDETDRGLRDHGSGRDLGCGSAAERRLVRVAIADACEAFRVGLRTLLAAFRDLRITAVVAHAGKLDLDATPSDVLLFDGGASPERLRHVAALGRRVATVGIVAGCESLSALAAARAGALAVVLRDADSAVYANVVRAAAGGTLALPVPLQMRLLDEYRRPGELSTREKEVVKLVAIGLRNHEVARMLYVSESTVKTHLNNVFAKVGVRDRVELALYAWRRNLIGSEAVEAFPVCARGSGPPPCNHPCAEYGCALYAAGRRDDEGPAVRRR